MGITEMDLYSSEFERLTVDALSHMWEFRRLGMHPLSHLRAVQPFMPTHKPPLTHLDRGQAVHRLLCTVLETLQELAACSDSSEARYYLVLTKEYVERLKNYQVADALGLSDSTFYRTRREALRCFVRLLAEIEQAERVTV